MEDASRNLAIKVEDAHHRAKEMQITRAQALGAKAYLCIRDVLPRSWMWQMLAQ
jgi:hypothetical protein